MSGLPTISALSTYGGALVNYAPVEDPTTDRDALAANIAYADCAAMTQTAVRAWARFVTSATVPTLAVPFPNDATWPNVFANLPVLTRSAVGVFLLTWPTTVIDALGATQTLNFRGCGAPNLEGAALAGFANATVTAANVVTVRTFSTAFAASDIAATTIFVPVY